MQSHLVVAFKNGSLVISASVHITVKEDHCLYLVINTEQCPLLLMLYSFVRGKELHLLGGDSIGNDLSTMYFTCMETSPSCLVLTSALSGRLCVHMKCYFSEILCYLHKFIWCLKHPKLCCSVSKKSVWKESLHWSPEGQRKSHGLRKQVPKKKKKLTLRHSFFMNYITLSSYSGEIVTQLFILHYLSLSQQSVSGPNATDLN